MDSLTSVLNTLIGLVMQAFSAFVQLVLSILSIFVVIFEAIARALHVL